MAKLTRVTGKVFGSAATATVRGIGQFGSAAAGSPNLTTDVATIQALPAYLNGWGSAVITSRNFPPIEEVTGVLKTISYQTCYNLQEGVAEYDINTEYTNTSIVKSTNNGIITFYASLQDNNIGNSLTDTDYWKPTVLNLDNKADKDLSNINPTQNAKNTIIGWEIPNWSSAVSFTPSSGDAVGFNGWLQCEISSGYANTACTASINGVVICKTSSGSSSGIPDASASVVMVKSTDVITMSHPEITTLKKIPFAGGSL